MDDVEVLLVVANALVEQNDPEVAKMLELLDSLPIDDLDVPIQGAIYHAQMMAEAALNQSSAHAAVARFALLRVVRLIEQRVAVTVGYRDFDTRAAGNLAVDHTRSEFGEPGR